jgi:PilZ domain
MENTLGNSLVPLSPPRKFSARAALVDLHENSRILLSECFRQFGIDSVAMTGEKAERLASEKFEACVVHVGSKAAPLLESARRSRSNSRMVIYGLGGTIKDAMNLSQFGINAIFHEPLERSSAMKLVRSTQMLVLHEFRRYARIPVITQVSVIAGTNHRQFEASSVEISTGGMSLKCASEVAPGLPVEVSFALLTLPRVWVRGTVTWTKASDKSFGVRFDRADDRRKKVKEWVESYLES